jgi:hypothetical protein
MELSPAYHTSNPITRAELNYQARSVPQGRRWQRFVGRLTLILSFVLAFILAGGEFAGALLYRDPEPINRFIGVGAMLPFGFVLFLHFALMFRTLSLSANSIAREKQANNWDILVMTGINARQIIRGKWWATVRGMWRAYLLLAVLRAAVIIWYGAYMSRTSTYGLVYFYQNYSPTPITIQAPTLLHFLGAALAVFAFTMVNLPFTAACGISAISARARNSALVLARAISTRLLLILGVSIGMLAIFYFMWARLFQSNYELWAIINQISVFAQGVGISLLDNGVTIPQELVIYRTDQYFDYQRESLVWIILISLVIYGLFTWMLLRLAEWLAVRQNALPPLRHAISESV